MTDLKTAAQIVAAVMEDVQSLAKKQKNEQQGFNFRGIDAVMNVVGPALRAHGGFIAPNLQSVEYDTGATKSGGITNKARVVVTYSVHGQTGEPLSGSVAAEAFDSGDKATAKAMSVAYRTFLLQLLCLPTDEPDPDTFTYVSAVADWDAVIEGLTSKEDARKLWNEAKDGKAPRSVLQAIELKGAAFSE